MKLFIAQCNPIIGAISYNATKIIQAIKCARQERSELVVCSELIIPGYCPDDLLFEPGFIEACDKALEEIISHTEGIAVILGTVRKNIGKGKPFRNTAAVIENGKLIGYQDKWLLPTYDVFDEARYMEAGDEMKSWDLCGKKVAITICEDMWRQADSYYETLYERDPIAEVKKLHVDLVVNISASPYFTGKIAERNKVAARVASQIGAPLLMVNQVGAQDGVIYDGSSIFVSEKGRLLVQAPSFKECFFAIIPEEQKYEPVELGNELFNALTLGLRDYFQKQGFSKACLGISGGIDSAVVACIAVHALGAENVLGVLLPSRYTSEESRRDALQLASNLQIKTVELSIEETFTASLDTLSPLCKEGVPGIASENLQSRIRGLLLMAISNSFGHLLLNTGNKSELAMGYTTLYGDSCGSIAVLGDLLKREVYQVARWINSKNEVIPEEIIQKVPTAELRPGQKDSDTLPEYPILDTIVQEFVVEHLEVSKISERHGFSLDLVKKVCQTIMANEYKRRQLPFALRVSRKAFSSGRKVPIVQKFELQEQTHSPCA